MARPDVAGSLRRESMGMPRRFTSRDARRASSSRSRTRSRSSEIGPPGFLTKSTAPSSSARMAGSRPDSDAAPLNMTTGRGVSLMMYPSAPIPSSSGISISSVTRSGSRAWTFFNASSPFRAVPMTRNSPEPSIISETSLRMNALSSTTRTVGSLEDDMAGLERFDGQPSIAHIEVHAAAVIAANVLRHDRNAGVLERGPRRNDVSLADLQTRRRQERGEHARAANDFGAHAPRTGA